MSQTIIQAENLTKMYGNYAAVNNVTFSVNKGDICGLIGKNGAGKTTLIRILTNLISATSGTFAVTTEHPRTDTTVAAIVETPSIYTNMNGLDNLICQSKLLGLPVDVSHCRETLQLVGLDPADKKRAANYSLGMRQRLAIAMALVGEPELLILDEPTNGLDPQGIYDMRELFVKINKEKGVTLLISSHILAELGKYATTYCFMDHGKVIRQISNEELLKQCKKVLRLFADNVPAAQAALEKAGIPATVGADHIDVDEEKANITSVLPLLTAAGVNVTGVVTVGDNLEDYFLNLIGGDAQ